MSAPRPAKTSASTRIAQRRMRPAEGVVATRPLAVMRNGVKPIVRLRFANGQELRCTPNHRLWTLNRGYVAAEELTADDSVLLNDVGDAGRRRELGAAGEGGGTREVVQSRRHRDAPGAARHVGLRDSAS